MSTAGKWLLGLGTLIFLWGCLGGQKTAPIPVEKTGAQTDTTGAPVFAESDFLNIDIDMMAEQMFRDLKPMTPPKVDSVEAYNAVYNMLLDSLLAREAIDFDLTTEPLLHTQYLDLKKDQLIRYLYKEYILDSIFVDDSTVHRFYESNKENFHQPDKYRARHIVIGGQNLKGSPDSVLYQGLTMTDLDSIARIRVEELRERILTGANFDTLAIMYSKDQFTASKGGDLGYFELAQMVPPFDSTVANTPIGQVSGVIRTMYGWHVLRVEDFQPAHYTPVDSVFEQIKSQLIGQEAGRRATRFVDSLLTTDEITVDTAMLMLDDSLQTPHDVLAIVLPRDKDLGNDTLYRKDYFSMVGAYAKNYGLTMPLELEHRLGVVKTLASPLLIYRAAHIFGYDSDPEIVAWENNIKLRYAVATLRKGLLEDNWQPSDEELLAYYESHLDKYQIERPVKVQHIIFADSNLAEHVRDLAMSGMDFMSLVDEYYPGDPDIRRVAADLDYIGPDDMPASFYRAAQRTPVNAISRPVKTEYGYHLIKVLDHKPTSSFEAVKSNIHSMMIRQHQDTLRREYVHQRLGASLVIHWEMLPQLYRKEPPPVDFSEMLNRL